MNLQIRTEDAVTASPVDTLHGRRLTLLLHGLGADERDLLSIAPALGDDAVISLRGPLPWGPGFAWVMPTEGPGRGAGLAPAAEAVLAWLDALPGAGFGTPSAVRLLGFSQGGALALTLLRHAPARFDRVVVLAGFVPDERHAGDAALARDPSVPVFWGRGAADAVIDAASITRTEAWLSQHASATVRVYPGLAHGISAEELDDVAAFLR